MIMLSAKYKTSNSTVLTVEADRSFSSLISQTTSNKCLEILQLVRSVLSISFTLLNFQWPECQTQGIANLQLTSRQTAIFSMDDAKDKDSARASLCHRVAKGLLRCLFSA